MIKKLVFNFLMLSVCFSFTAVAQEEKITSSNWQHHPKINQVRAIVNAIDASLKNKSLKVSKREFDYCEPYEDTIRIIAVDSKGVVRRYESQAGSDDSALTFRHYYDDTGRLRFVFITGGAANGTQLEHRIYFDESGNRIWEDHKYVKGPGYTWPEVWPEDQNGAAPPIQRFEPAKAFAAKSNCEEKKRRVLVRHITNSIAEGRLA